jgi:beta-glucosidase
MAVSFADATVLSQMQSGPNKIDYSGSAISLFQSEPLIRNGDGRIAEHSDWEYILKRQLLGKSSRLPDFDPHVLPHFLDHSSEYINRSAHLGENMFRLSFEFPRLCPKPKEFDEALMARYIRILAHAKAIGLEPLVTLHHYTLPLYLTKLDKRGEICAGGWEHPDILGHVQFYIENVAQRLCSKDFVRRAIRYSGFDPTTHERIIEEGLVKYFLTINEPAAVALHGYSAGIFPPYKKAHLWTAYRILRTLGEAHARTYGALKDELLQSGIRVGASYNWQHSEGLLAPVTRLVDRFTTRALERKGDCSDFIGLQYYMRLEKSISETEKKERDWSDHPGFGDIFPAGILEVLKRMHKAYPQKPIFVTEFGFAEHRDMRRPYWILETLRYILEAVRIGIPIEGVLLWSLVRNFEWDQAISQDFGLFEESQLREPLRSTDDHLRSWEVWNAANKALRTPTPENWRALEAVYERAQQQYRFSGGKY